MKTRITLSLCVLTLCAYTQEFEGVDSLTSTPFEQAEHVLEHLDKGEISTGFLYDKGLPLADFFNFNGTVDTGFISARAVDFGLTFASITSMALDTMDMIHPNDYASKIINIGDSTIVPLGIIHYKYEAFKDEVLDSNLIYESGGQLYDTPGRI